MFIVFNTNSKKQYLSLYRLNAVISIIIFYFQNVFRFLIMQINSLLVCWQTKFLPTLLDSVFLLISAANTNNIYTLVATMQWHSKIISSSFSKFWKLHFTARKFNAYRGLSQDKSFYKRILHSYINNCVDRHR